MRDLVWRDVVRRDVVTKWRFHHPGAARTPRGPPRCIASGVRRLKRAQARFSKPRLTLGQEGSPITIHESRSNDFYRLIG
jgi:hypothetical protein